MHSTCWVPGLERLSNLHKSQSQSVVEPGLKQAIWLVYVLNLCAALKRCCATFEKSVSPHYPVSTGPGGENEEVALLKVVSSSFLICSSLSS